MSWLEKIKEGLKITTGDGKTYTPQWLNASFSVDYNISEFDFSGVSGTLVKKSQPKGVKYSLQLFFTGEDHLDISSEFKKSSNDTRNWKISHPFYGVIICQPISLEFDNTNYNTTEIKGVVIETINEDFPSATIVPTDYITLLSEKTGVLIAQSLDNSIQNYGVEASTKTSQRNFINKINANFGRIISQSDKVENYYNLYNDALSNVNILSTYPTESINFVQSLINAPAQFNISVKDRITSLGDSITSLTDSFPRLLLGDKQLIESNGCSLISSICLSASLPYSSDYDNRIDVIYIIELILDYYNDYLTFLDSIQSENGGNPTSYMPDADTLTSLSQLVDFTISNLFSIASDSKQERSLILENDSNWIILAHRLYGLKTDDSTISELINQNGAGLNEMLQVKKNRVIKYYI